MKTIFSKIVRSVGDLITVSDREGNLHEAIIVKDFSQDSRFMNQKVKDSRNASGERVVNSGQGYYGIEIK